MTHDAALSVRVEALLRLRRQFLRSESDGEDAIHDRCSAADGGDDHVSIDSLGDVSGLVAYGVADVLDRDAVVAHDRDECYLYWILRRPW